jgi:hypothetical protein
LWWVGIVPGSSPRAGKLRVRLGDNGTNSQEKALEAAGCGLDFLWEVKGFTNAAR